MQWNIHSGALPRNVPSVGRDRRLEERDDHPALPTELSRSSKIANAA
jgi:hypothetical protein